MIIRCDFSDFPEYYQEIIDIRNIFTKLYHSTNGFKEKGIYDDNMGLAFLLNTFSYESKEIGNIDVKCTIYLVEDKKEWWNYQSKFKTEYISSNTDIYSNVIEIKCPYKCYAHNKGMLIYKIRRVLGRELHKLYKERMSNVL